MPQSNGHVRALVQALGHLHGRLTLLLGIRLLKELDIDALVDGFLGEAVLAARAGGSAGLALRLAGLLVLLVQLRVLLLELLLADMNALDQPLADEYAPELLTDAILATFERSTGRCAS